MKQLTAIYLLIAFLVTPLSMPAHGDAGHDEQAPASQPTQAPKPRLEIQSAAIELVAVPDTGKLTLYADRYATNEPVNNAVITVAYGATQSLAKPLGDGIYILAADWLNTPGIYALTITVQGDGLNETLQGSLQIPDPQAHESSSRPWLNKALWVSGIIGALLLLLWGLRRWRRRARAPLLATGMVIMALAYSPPPVFAHGGEEHGGADSSQPASVPAEQPSAAAPSGNLKSADSTPQIAPRILDSGTRRLADGAVFMPKSTQRLLGIRTVVAEKSDISLSVELNGQVIANPNYSGQVQAPQAGRIDAPEGGLPHVGKAVVKGEVLAHLIPLVSSLDRSNQQAQLAELSSSLSLARQRVQRLQQLAGSVPRKDIEAARVELRGLEARIAALSSGLNQSQSLTSPVSGIIHHANLVAGQIVEARDVLFEIVNPGETVIEALAYDPTIADQIAAAHTFINDKKVPLAYLGQGGHLHEQALPLQFKLAGEKPSLSLGQPLKIFVQTSQKISGAIALPQDSIVKASNGETLVWVHGTAEQFVPKKVRVQSLGDDPIIVLEGLQAGERAVIQGAPLLAQVR